MVVVAGTIVWSFLSRQQPEMVLPDGKLLSADVNYRTTKFEYFEHKQGNTIFKVEAEVGTESVGGVHTLKNVKLTRFAEGQKISDTIHGEEAIYKIQEKQIQFSGDVQVNLADATRILSRRVHADLNQELIQIDEEFQFERGEVKGKGKSLVYRIPDKDLQITGDFQLSLPSADGWLEAKAQKSLYRLKEERMDLEEEAQITGPEGSLAAERMEIFLTTGKRVQKILSTGKAEFRSRSQAFTGHQINAFFDPELKKLEHFEVVGSPHAVYEEQLPGGLHHLEAAHITARVDDEHLGLKEFVARQNVFFRSSALAIDEAHAGELTGSFSTGGMGLEGLQMRGKVSVRRGAQKQQERLQCESLVLNFTPERKLRDAEARGNVHLEMNAKEEQRRLFTEDAVKLEYASGLLEKVTTNHALFESRTAKEKQILRAPVVEAFYQKGVIQKVTAEGGTRVELHGENEVRNTSSRRLDLAYKDGKLLNAVQSGDFYYWSGEGEEKAELKAERAIYTLQDSLISITGSGDRQKSAGPFLQHSGSRTFAERFVLDRTTGKISALGDVRSLLSREETVITAARMEADPESGWVEYTEGPRIILRGNSITGNQVRANNRDERLVVEGTVRSFLVYGEQAEKRKYWITAGRLTYGSKEPVAHYEKEVLIKTENLTLKAPLVDVLFESGDSNQLKQLTARGGVEIVQQNRRANGDQAIYDPAEEKVVLTGNAAQVIEPKKGKSSGRRLTFYIHTERVLVESSPGAGQKQ